MNTSKLFNNVDLGHKEQFQKLWDYYNQNGLYEGNQTIAQRNGTWVEAVKPLRVCVNRSVEFYVSKILSGEVTISADKEAVKKSIEQVWKWSNFNSQKQVFSRYLALTGNLFVKVVNDESKVYFENIDPELVTDFTVDTRGYLKTIRLDIPITVDGKNLTHTEYWSKPEGYYSIWEHAQGENTALEQLGEPKDVGFLAELGIDFVPFVFIKFKDAGEKWGVGAVNHALDKIDDANRQSTRLEQLLFRFNKPTMVVSANDKDAQGRPIPAPKVKTSGNTDRDLELSDNGMMYMPGMSGIESLIPNINYADALNILNAMMNEIEQDLPELKYYSIKDQLSGKAVSMLLAGAVDRANEARANFIAGMERLNEMALTIGEFNGFFPGIGSYENGDFNHSIQCGEMFPLSLNEKATTLKTFVEAGLPLATAMRFSGYSVEEIQTALQEKEQEETTSQNALANTLMNFNKG